jgi:hypothetical protein
MDVATVAQVSPTAATEECCCATSIETTVAAEISTEPSTRNCTSSSCIYCKMVALTSIEITLAAAARDHQQQKSELQRQQHLLQWQTIQGFKPVRFSAYNLINVYVC